MPPSTRLPTWCMIPLFLVAVSGLLGLVLSPAPVHAEGAIIDTAIDAGRGHTCAVTSAGGIRCWGDNSSGQLGNSSTTGSAIPVAVCADASCASPLTGVTAVGAGALYTCAVTSAGSVRCWGNNFSGQLGNSSTTGSAIPVAVCADASCASPLTGVTAVSAGGGHTCAVTSAGGIHCWGDNSSGQLGDSNVGDFMAVPVAIVGFGGVSFTTITFVSDRTWGVFDADPAAGAATFLGFAQKVCLSPSFPSPCPSGATVYGSPSWGWVADLSSIPEASWIWAPGITGATATADLNQFFFAKAFELLGPPITGTIFVAVDDFAEIRVNGTVVGTYGSTTEIPLAIAADKARKAFDITPFLVVGSNIITIHAQNGPHTFSPLGCTVCTYAQNPAGVVFGGSIRFQPTKASR